ncbi:Hpt domain-containing protein [Singulisphaera acidiphila]|uniref:histidine kinase n=4 Tax=Singulisphaera acidiphila TaxID=466153 RepID=L0DJG8_SINAD|nr:Hpt domain-containing protein [Singulisphaera acidiphila]AGA28990.1 chemotaxis protein histidine kinase-like protein [Singulisphaera acidiphila DSM 18658]
MSDDLSGFSMMELFRTEAESQTAILSEGLLTVETSDGSSAVFEPLMRAAHSLKGAARIVGVNAAVRIAHAMEDCLVAAQHGKVAILPHHIDILLRAVDLLSQTALVAEDQLNEWETAHEASIAGMETELAAILSGEAAPTPPVAEPQVAPTPVSEPLTTKPQAVSDDLSGFSMMELFRTEAESQTAILSEGLLAVETSDGSSAIFEPLMRAAHSLKGAARIVGVNAAVRIAHAMEDCLVAAQHDQVTILSHHIDILLRAVDLLNQTALVAEDQLNEWETAHEASIAGMEAELASILSGEALPTAEPQVTLAPASEPLATKPQAVSDDLSGFSMMELFRTEAESQTAILSEGLLTVETSDGSSAVFEPLMRAAHSLKGAARIVGVNAAVRIAHAMEDCLVAAQHGKVAILPHHIDILLRAVDLLSQTALVAEDQLNEWETAHEASIAGMEAELAAILSGQGAPPPLPVAAVAPPPVAAAPQVAAPPVPPAKAPVTPAKPAASPKPKSESRATAERTPPAAPEQAERVVRVTAESLTRLMGLAGESLVQTRQLRPFVTSLLTLKGRQTALLETIQTLEDRRESGRGLDPAVLAEVLAKAKAQANECLQGLGKKMEEFEEIARRSEDLSGRLHHEVLTSRMRPMADGVRGFPRMVRDVARQLGKSVRFEVLGETTGVDRDILDKLEAPLNHLIRNALDHAIELPDQRLAAGKNQTGTIRMEARHRAGMLQITLTDDGQGIDPERLRVKVVERGLVGARMAEQLTEAELLEFLFLPGFSTKDAVTELSGRGVGLDVVQNMVKAVGGIVRVSSQVGKGTRFSLQLPITMSVIRALLVRIAGEPYAFPLNRIDRILRVPRSDVQILEGRQHFSMDDQPVGLVEATQVLNFPPVESADDFLSVVVASDRSHRFGVVVDEFLGERDLEVRPLDARLGRVPNINSASVLEDGWPVLIIDVEDMVRSIDNLLGGRRLNRVAEAAEQSSRRGPKRILVVDDSITVRELERQLLESRGYVVEVAVDGVDGWNTVRGGDYHLVISDVDMPRMDGIQLVQHIKSDARLKGIPVVIVSYKDREEDRMRGLDAGANCYLTKSSFHDRTFLDTVVDLIGEAVE